jgi:hypothetical protein
MWVTAVSQRYLEHQLCQWWLEVTVYSLIIWSITGKWTATHSSSYDRISILMESDSSYSAGQQMAIAFLELGIWLTGFCSRNSIFFEPESFSPSILNSHFVKHFLNLHQEWIQKFSPRFKTTNPVRIRMMSSTSHSNHRVLLHYPAIASVPLSATIVPIIALNSQKIQ